MDEGIKIQQEINVPDVPAVTFHISPRHKGRDDGETEKSRGPPEGNSSINNKDGYWRRSQNPTKGNSSSIRKRKNFQKARR